MRTGDRLEIVETDPAARAAWQSDGRKLERLDGYWLHRAIDAFVAYVAADPTRWEIGLPENADANRFAWLRAQQAQLRLREVYGVEDEVPRLLQEARDALKEMVGTATPPRVTPLE